MNIINKINKINGDTKVGDIFKITFIKSQTFLDDIYTGDIVRVSKVYKRRTDNSCSEKMKQYCSQISKDKCVLFEAIDDDTKFIWSCYCLAERIF